MYFPGSLLLCVGTFMLPTPSSWYIQLASYIAMTFCDDSGIELIVCGWWCAMGRKFQLVVHHKNEYLKLGTERQDIRSQLKSKSLS